MANYRYRTFEGERYRRSDVSWATKTNAKKHAKHMRSLNYKIRVTQLSNGRWVTWARE